MIRYSMLIGLLFTLLLSGCGLWGDDGASYDEGTPLKRFQAADDDANFDVAMPTETAGLQLVSVESGDDNAGYETVRAEYEDPEDPSRAVEFVQSEIGFIAVAGIEDAMPVTVMGGIGRLIHDPDGSIRLYWTTSEGYMVEGSNVGEETVLQIARSVTLLDEIGPPDSPSTEPPSEVLEEIEQELRGIQDQVDVPLYQPTTAPPGHTNASVLNASPSDPPDAMLVVIELRPAESDSDSVITIVQARNTSGPRLEPDETRTIMVGNQEATLEEAGLQNDATLLTIVWEEGGVSYEVGGVDVAEDTLVSIAESLRPLDDTN